MNTRGNNNEINDYITKSVRKLLFYIETEGYKGYDPYDILNSFIPFKLLGRWGPVLVTQLQKRNPINIRPLIGIKKNYNPKGVGLFLKAYCNLYKLTKDECYLEQAQTFFYWLSNNYSQDYSGYCWGYNFPWASSSEYKEAYLPSVVVTSTVIDGVYSYYKITESEDAKKIIISASKYIMNDIPVTKWDEGLSFAYTHKSKGACYNASLHAVEVLAKAKLLGAPINDDIIRDSVNYVISKQKVDGSWYYSYDPVRKTERKQIDFHQGFIIVSLYNIMFLTGLCADNIKVAIKKAAHFYWEQQFSVNGRSYWRLPKKSPVDIHNQSQGIITFAALSDLDNKYIDFAEKILLWTINNMQDDSGYFYYRIYPLFVDKTPYMRWGQAWMLLAFSEYMHKLKLYSK